MLDPVHSPIASLPDSLNVDLGARSYPILFEAALSGFGGALKKYAPAEDYFIVTDANVAELYLPALQNEVKVKAKAVHIIPPGEASKSFAHYKALCESFLEKGITRRSAIIALGGGVVGDLAGFAAATLLRGVTYIQVPTTLLAQVDSAVGGKTGINTDQGKNLIGSFYQPALVYSCSDVLASLPRRQMIAGYGEIVKYALIGDPEFFNRLDENAAALIAGDTDMLRYAVLKSCAAKAGIVACDERESGLRALLNLGHTFGHALEAAAGYDGSLLHGEAVLIGMDMALAYSVERGIAPPESLERLRAHYNKHGLRPDYKITAAADRLLESMQKDKKNRKDHIVLVLLKDIGQAYIDTQQPVAALKDFLENYLK